jgi:hypothetical protein
MDSKGKSIGLNENKKKRNEDGPWLDGHLPKEEITGHGKKKKRLGGILIRRTFRIL